jgi:hypothetical protein
MRLVRVWLPVAIVAAGLIVIVATGGSETGVEGGAGIIGAGASVWLLNVIFRVGVQGERDRDAEDEARDFYDAHGYWPDEAPAAGAEPPAAPGPPPPGDALSGDAPSGDAPSGPDPSADPHRPAPHRRSADPRRSPDRSGGTARRPPRRP